MGGNQQIIQTFEGPNKSNDIQSNTSNSDIIPVQGQHSMSISIRA